MEGGRNIVFAIIWVYCHNSVNKLMIKLPHPGMPSIIGYRYGKRYSNQ
jgi:hypothetical protein